LKTRTSLGIYPLTHVIAPRWNLRGRNIWAPQVSGSKSDWDVEIKKWVLLHTHKYFIYRVHGHARDLAGPGGTLAARQNL
jgi:hypothetical protein